MDKNIDGKIGTTISLKHSTYLLIKQKGINLSSEIEEWLEKKYMDNQTILNNLLKEKEVVESKIVQIQAKIDLDKIKAEEQIKNLSPELIAELTESIEVLSTRGEKYLDVRLMRYNNMVKEKIDIIQFKWLMEKVKQIYIK